jgi:hypothetical protein
MEDYRVVNGKPPPVLLNLRNGNIEIKARND